jgi:hypothetical protein
MRGLIPEKLEDWTEYQSEADFGNVLLQLFAHMGDILSYYQDRVANESFLATARERRSIIHHLRLIGYRLATAAPASTVLQLSIPAGDAGTVTIQNGDAFATKSQKDKPSVRFEYTAEIPLVIPMAGEAKIAALPVEEGRLVKDEIIGKSDGSANQRFRLAHTGLILQSLGLGSQIKKDVQLVTDLNGVKEEWVLRDSLAFSQQGQTHFIIEIDEEDRADVVFGDGQFGAIPPSGAYIYVTYRKGGGAHGNVAAHTIQTIVDAPALVLLGATVTNPTPATGGADRETIEHAVQHAPGVFRSGKRAVTAADYKELALYCKGVGKVRAEKGNWNIVFLYVAPEGGGNISDVLKKNLLAYFEDKRPVSTIVEIRDVDYVKMYITARIGIHGYYAWDAVREKAVQAVAGLLDFQRVDFGQTLFVSKFYEALEAVEGVEYVTITRFRREDTLTRDHISLGKIILRKNEIPVIPDESGGIEIINDRTAEEPDNATQEY